MPRPEPTYKVPTEDLPVRSLYMRLFRSWLDKEDYYHAALVGGEITWLLNRGHAEPVGAGYRITETGCKAWAKMNAQLLTDVSVRKQRSQQLSYIAALKEFYEDDGDQDMNSEFRNMLILLDERGDWTDCSQFPKTAKMSIAAHRFADKQARNIYRINERGRAWLRGEVVPGIKGQAAQETIPALETDEPDMLPEMLGDQVVTAHLLEDKKIFKSSLVDKADAALMTRLLKCGYVTLHSNTFWLTTAGEAYLRGREEASTTFSNAPAETDAAEEAAVEITIVEPPDDAGKCGDCDCLPARVLARVMDRMPEVRDLFELVHQEERILQKLGK